MNPRSKCTLPTQLGFWVALAVFTACAQDSAPPAAGAVGASAEDEDHVSWRVDEQAVVEIGVREGEPAYQLSGVRGAVRLSDGRLAIADASSREIRLFDATGRHLWSFGRSGEGPGEFRSVDGLWMYRGDSLLVLDKGNRRFTVIDASGRLARTGPLGDGRAVATVRGVFEDGSILGESPVTSPRVADGELFDTEAAYLRLSPDGAVTDSLGRFPQVRSAMVTNAAGRVTWLALFGPISYFDARGTRVLIGTARTSEVTVLDVSAESTVRIALPDPVRPFTERDLERFSSWVFADATSDEDRTRKQAQIDQSLYTDVFATHGPVRFDSEGNAWVQRAQESFSDPKSQRWWVFGTDGRQRATVELPLADQIVDVGADYVLLVRKDAVGVEQVRQHRLVKQN